MQAEVEILLAGWDFICIRWSNQFGWKFKNVFKRGDWG